MRVRTDMVCCYVVRPSTDGNRWEFLQLRRRQGAFLGGTWQPVAGGIEEGETAIVAALRELREETSLTPREFYQVDEVDVFFIAAQDAIWHSVQFCAVVTRDDIVTLNAEHEDLRWVTAGEAEANFMWPGQKRAAREIINQILNNGLSKPHLRIVLPG